MEEKTELVTHLYTNPDPDQFSEQVNEFCKGKSAEDLNISLSTTVIPVQNGRGFAIIPSCIIQWKCSKEEAVSYKNRKKLSIQG